ncbi:MAG TPA: sigma-70 family RNA polymerase sigma factor [Bryobacteraceae bacterium]|nr:sigma-70 family RNA polymerase sigma factor [Bryobacteraceae bacterium]
MVESNSGPSHVSGIGTGVASAKAESASRQTALAGYLSRCAAGDQSALAALYDETSRLVYSMALRVLSQPSDAEEVTLDVYMQVWRSARAYTDKRGNVGTWLVMLARSRAIDRLRSRQSRASREELLPEHIEFPSPDPTPEQSTEASRQREKVRSALASLPPEQREALELAVFSGLTHYELAAKLNQPLGTVKTRVRQGMIKVRQFLMEPA